MQRASMAALRLILRVSGCTASRPRDMYDTDQPWVVYVYRYHDRALNWWGYSFVRCECCICGQRADTLIHASPRWLYWLKGKDREYPNAYRHPLRAQFLLEHQHASQASNPMTWAMPLRNPAALWRNR